MYNYLGYLLFLFLFLFFPYYIVGPTSMYIYTQVQCVFFTVFQ